MSDADSQPEHLDARRAAKRIRKRQWRDPGVQQTFFLGLTAVWSTAVLVALAVASLLHFVEVSSACGRTINGRSGNTTADVVFDGARVFVACRGPASTTEIPMNAPAAGLLISALGLVLTAAFLITYRVLRKRAG
jgi:hypothetical protein